MRTTNVDIQAMETGREEGLARQLDVLAFAEAMEFGNCNASS